MALTLLFLHSFSLQSLILDELLDESVCPTSSVMQVQAMARQRRHIRASLVLVQVRVQLGQHSSSKIRRRSAVAEAEGQIRVAVDDSHSAGVVGRRHSDGRQAEELAVGGGPFGGVGGGEDVGVEVGGAEEADLGVGGGAADEVAIVEGREAVGLVLVGDLEVDSQDEGGEGSAVGGVAGEDDGVKEVGVLAGHGLADDGAEGVAGADDGGEGGVGEGAGLELAGEGGGDFDLKRSLDLLDGVGFGGETYAETVVGESCVAILDGDINVGVAGGKVPVEAVEADTVSQKLNAIWRGVVCGCAEGCANFE